MNREQIVLRLMGEFDYPKMGATIVADQLLRLTGPLYAAFLNWWIDGTEPLLSEEGYTVRRLKEEHGMNSIAAILTLDWLSRQPEKALASLRKAEAARQAAAV